MGVPILFSWLNQKHPNCIRKEPPKDVDIVYLDLNAIIHNCYNANLPTMKEIYEDMVKRLKSQIDNIIYKTNPKKILYIAVDGVAPGAKLAHQRSRRYKAAYDKQKNTEEIKLNSEINENDDLEFAEKFIAEEELLVDNVIVELENEKFDSNAITPGTELMEILHGGILDILMESLSTDVKYKHLKIIYSNYQVPGEGEQKIMEFIRRYHAKSPNDVHLMYSPDGDIIFLGVGLYNVNLYIMREDTFNNKNKKEICNVCSKMGHKDYQCGNPEFLQYSYIDVPEFRKVLIHSFNYNIKTKYNKRRMLVDWVFACFLIGNDFLPGLPCFDIKISSIEAITNLISRNYIYTNEYITTDDNMINFHILEKFFIALSKLEDGYYIAKTKMLNRFCEGNREEIPIHTRAGKLKYYSVKLYANNQNDIDAVCIEYIKGMIWIFNYYINGRTDWQWVYPYHFAPCAQDLAKVTRANFRLNRGNPLSPFEQLLVVIPPQSSNLLPEKLRYIYDKYKELYPIDVETDMFDKYLSWTSVILLPHMNSQIVLKEAKTVMNEIPVSELDRNTRDSDLLLVADKKLVTVLDKVYNSLKPAVCINLDGLDADVTSYYKAILPDEEYTLYNGRQIRNKSMIVRINIK